MKSLFAISVALSLLAVAVVKAQPMMPPVPTSQSCRNFSSEMQSETDRASRAVDACLKSRQKRGSGNCPRYKTISNVACCPEADYWSGLINDGQVEECYRIARLNDQRESARQQFNWQQTQDQAEKNATLARQRAAVASDYHRQQERAAEERRERIERNARNNQALGATLNAIVGALDQRRQYEDEEEDYPRYSSPPSQAPAPAAAMPQPKNPGIHPFLGEDPWANVGTRRRERAEIAEAPTRSNQREPDNRLAAISSAYASAEYAEAYRDALTELSKPANRDTVLKWGVDYVGSTIVETLRAKFADQLGDDFSPTPALRAEYKRELGGWLDGASRILTNFKSPTTRIKENLTTVRGMLDEFVKRQVVPLASAIEDFDSR